MDDGAILGAARAWFVRDGCPKPSSTYQGSVDLPFQRWFRFKEAFSPRFVFEAIESAPRAVGSVLDPFSGSGTTALSAQFMGVRPWAVEVNPFLADLAEAKLEPHAVDDVVRESARVLAAPTARAEEVQAVFLGAPRTFVEPGDRGRWLLDMEVARDVVGLARAVDLAPPSTARLLRVLLASCVVGASNAVTSGKGRRYRGNWRDRDRGNLRAAVADAVSRAVADVESCGRRAYPGYDLVRGDAREVLDVVDEVDMALFSPPYCNSFDYTDVYNVELWALGYLATREDNRRLRTSTLRSHVQVHRPYPAPTRDVPGFRSVAASLRAERDALWNRNIPDMVSGYFGDMERVLEKLATKVRKGGRVVVVVGDSRYGTTLVPAAEIMGAMALECGYDSASLAPLRTMRSSPQQGGRHELVEYALTLSR